MNEHKEAMLALVFSLSFSFAYMVLVEIVWFVFVR